MHKVARLAWLPAAAWTSPPPAYKPAMPAISALLLDLDGTLLDTEPLHFEAHRRFLATQGIVPTEAELLGNIGKGDRTFYRELMQNHGRSGDVDAWVQLKAQALIDLYRSGGVPLQTGARELLDHAASEGIPCLVVTSSEREVARCSLAAAGLAERLPMRICREDTVRHKPHPEPYLLATLRLSQSPGSCLVVEDSDSGVASAHSAGCPVVALRGHVPEARLRAAGALRVVASLAELVPLSRLRSGIPGP